MKAYKINQVLASYTIPIQQGTTPQDRYPFLTSAPYNQYFTLNLIDILPIAKARGF